MRVVTNKFTAKQPGRLTALILSICAVSLLLGTALSFRLMNNQASYKQLSRVYDEVEDVANFVYKKKIGPTVTTHNDQQKPEGSQTDKTDGQKNEQKKEWTENDKLLQRGMTWDILKSLPFKQRSFKEYKIRPTHDSPNSIKTIGEPLYEIKSNYVLGCIEIFVANLYVL